jgi:hypothetical protein
MRPLAESRPLSGLHGNELSAVGRGRNVGCTGHGVWGAASKPYAAGEPELEADDWTSEWRRLALPDPRLSARGITRTPGGWLLVSSGGRAFGSYMYRSSDGVRWTRVHLPDDGVDLTGVAYGGGRYVVVGHGADRVGHLIWVLRQVLRDPAALDGLRARARAAG